jgi:hypothetical protein
MAATLTNNDKPEALQRTNGLSRRDVRGSSGNVGDVERRDNRPLAERQRELFEVQGRRLSQFAQRLGLGLTLGSGVGLRVQPTEPTLRRGPKDCGEFHSVTGARHADI